MATTRDELITGGVLGLVLGCLVTFALARQADNTPHPGPEPDLAPLQVSDFGSDDREQVQINSVSQARKVRRSVGPSRRFAQS